jgi:hypothetical protein
MNAKQAFEFGNKRLLQSFLVLSLSLLAACAPASPQEEVLELPDDQTQEEILPPTAEDLVAEEEVQKLGFYDPSEDEVQTYAVKGNYSHLDPKGLIPDKLLNAAVTYYDANLSKIANKNYLSVIDFGQHSSKARFWVIEMSSGSVWAMHVAHGSGSDPNHDGYADRFSNTSGSNASSLGFYRAAETYSGKHGYSLRLDGLSTTNSNARRRAVVIHGASYVSEGNVKQGRSWGCPAVTMANRTKLINMIKGGSIIYGGK